MFSILKKIIYNYNCDHQVVVWSETNGDSPKYFRAPDEAIPYTKKTITRPWECEDCLQKYKQHCWQIWKSKLEKDAMKIAQLFSKSCRDGIKTGEESQSDLHISEPLNEMVSLDDICEAEELWADFEDHIRFSEAQPKDDLNHDLPSSIRRFSFDNENDKVGMFCVNRKRWEAGLPSPVPAQSDLDRFISRNKSRTAVDFNKDMSSQPPIMFSPDSCVRDQRDMLSLDDAKSNLGEVSPTMEAIKSDETLSITSGSSSVPKADAEIFPLPTRNAEEDLAHTVFGTAVTTSVEWCIPPFPIIEINGQYPDQVAELPSPIYKKEHRSSSYHPTCLIHKPLSRSSSLSSHWH